MARSRGSKKERMIERERGAPGRPDGREKKGAMRNKYMLKHTQTCMGGGSEGE